MVLAHLRGLLTPGYENGTRSWLRERTILEAMDSEIAYQVDLDMQKARAALAPALKEPVQYTERIVSTMSERHDRHVGSESGSRYSGSRKSAVQRYIDYAKQGRFGPEVAAEFKDA